MDALNPAKRRAAQRPTPQRVYVKSPRSLTPPGICSPAHHLGGWPHLCHRRGAGFPPPPARWGCDCRGDCYTVVIRGEESICFLSGWIRCFQGAGGPLVRRENRVRLEGGRYGRKPTHLRRHRPQKLLRQRGVRQPQAGHPHHQPGGGGCDPQRKDHLPGGVAQPESLRHSWPPAAV